MANSSGPLNSPKPTTSQIVGGVHNVVAPAPADGQALPLQQDANGNLLVNVAVGGGGGATSNVNLTGINGTAPGLTNPLPVELSDGTNPLGTAGNPVFTESVATSSTVVTQPTASLLNATVVQASVPADSSPATQNITIQDTSSTSGTGFDNQPIITGTPTANSAASFAVANFDTVRIQVTGTWTGTLQSELSMDGGTTWYINAVHLNGTSFTAATFTNNFQGEASASAVTNVRLRATAAVTGTAVVTINKSNTPSMINVVTPIRLQDSTTQSIGGTIKAASTAAVATDTALVVAVSPNNTVGMTGAALAETTAAWTNATTLNTTLAATVTGYSTVVVTFNQTTTVTGGAVTFEVSDANTNWYTVLAERVGQLAVAPSPTYTLQANTNASFQISVAGFVGFRVRLSTVMTGTGTINVGVQAQSSTFVPLSIPPATIETNTAASNLADNQANQNSITSNTNAAAPLGVGQWMYGGAFSGAANAALSGWSKARTPTVFRTVSATASGNTAIWTPGTGNKFRLLKLFVEVTDNASVATSGGTVLVIDIQDSSTTTNITFSVFVPQTAVTTVIGDGAEIQLDLGSFGILSAAANNVLNVNLSTALVAAGGVVRVIAMGTEE